MTELLDFLELGGPLMFVIALGSLVATTVFFERIWSLQRRRVVPRRLLELVLNSLRDRRYDEARGLCASSESPLASLLAAGIAHAGQPRARVREAIEDEADTRLLIWSATST